MYKRILGALVTFTVAMSAIPPAQSAVAPTRSAAPAAETAAADVTVSATYGDSIGPLDKDLLLNASQGGYLSLKNLHILADHAPDLAELGLRQIRIDHVFDDDFYGVVTSPTTYDFRKLDSILLPLVEHGIKPWISLSYMPKALGPSLFSPPNDNAAWARAVKAMVRHYADLGHTGWNWEVWNEPDDRAGFWTGTSAQYNAMYAASAQAVKEADPTAQVGGPAVAAPTTGLLGTWLDFIAANPGVPVDFVSWHSYGPNDFASTARIRNELSSRGIPSKKLYLNEWNSTFRMWNGPGTWPDTHQNASYAVHRMYEALDEPGLDGVFYFSPIEGWTPTRDFNGDLGMITPDGRRKAVGNAFAMIDSMGDTRLDTSVGGAASTATYGLVTEDGDQVSVLLWNNTLNSTSFDVALADLPYQGTNFAVTRSDIDAVNGNSYADWAGGIVNQRPSPHELLRPSSRTVAGPAQDWSTTVTLPPNGTTLIELTPTAEGVGDKQIAPVETEVNLARNKPVSVSSQYYDVPRGWTAQAAVDGRRYSIGAANAGNPTMGWTSREHGGANATEYFQVDLGARETFDEVTLWPRNDQGGDGHSFPADFTIAGSLNGTTWTPLVTETGYGGGEPVLGPQTFAVPGSSYRYVRVTATKLGLPLAEGIGQVHRFQLAELEVTKSAINVPVANPGFESGQLGGWSASGNATVVNSGARSGTYAARFTGARNGVITTVRGLEPGTSYTFSGYLRSAAAGDVVHLGVKGHGGPETSIPIGATSYTPVSVTFTTGATSRSAKLYAYKNSGTAQAWFDDFTLVRN